jgi:uncharacterized protein (DUF885 family)
MHFKALVSALALGAAVSLSGPVSAQEMMINGVAIPEDEMAAVQARCDELAEAAENESLSEPTEDDAADDSADDDTIDSAGEAGALIEDAPEVNEVEDATSIIDLDQIDLQACIDAGLVDDLP